MRSRPDEQTRQSFQERRDRLLPRLEVFEYLFLIVVGVFLILLVLVALVAAVIAVIDPLFHSHNYVDAVVQGIDSIFLAIILLELLHTTLSRGPLIQQVQEFLMIGITAAVRHSLAVGAERTNSPRDVVINLAINAVAVLILVCAMWLVRQRLLVETQSAPSQAIVSGGDHLDPSAVNGRDLLGSSTARE